MDLTFTPDDILTYATAEVIDGDRIQKALAEGVSLAVKLGIDPTSPDLHLGRTIPLWKLRAFQELGCDIHLIIGDFTGQVGDTSDKDTERPMLTEEVVAANMARYEEQLWMILNPAKKEKVHFHKNSEWLSKVSLGELSHLAEAFSVNTFVKRELIARRLEGGSRVSLREMLYPVMQGYDSLTIKADVELGGTDQRFNLLAGRTLQEQRGSVPQSLVMNVLISGTDGRKMSSSFGNGISLLDTPQDKFGKMMTVNDGQMPEYLLVLPHCVWPFAQEELTQRMQTENPRDLKLELAHTLVALYHGAAEADARKAAWVGQFSEKQLPSDIQSHSLNAATQLVDFMVETSMAQSKTEARRLIEQHGVRINGDTITDVACVLDPVSGTLIEVGKRQKVRLS